MRSYPAHNLTLCRAPFRSTRLSLREPDTHEFKGSKQLMTAGDAQRLSLRDRGGLPPVPKERLRTIPNVRPKETQEAYAQ